MPTDWRLEQQQWQQQQAARVRQGSSRGVNGALRAEATPAAAA